MGGFAVRAGPGKRSLRVLMVCTGNICRSPTAEGVLRHRLRAVGLAHRVEVDSAGTHGYHAGSPPDDRALEHALARGYDLSALRARVVAKGDFDAFDLILAMDEDHLDWLRARCPPALRSRVRPITEFCRRHRLPGVPDPYYGGRADFMQVLDLLEDACDGLVEHLGREIADRP